METTYTYDNEELLEWVHSVRPPAECKERCETHDIYYCPPPKQKTLNFYHKWQVIFAKFCMDHNINGLALKDTCTQFLDYVSQTGLTTGGDSTFKKISGALTNLRHIQGLAPLKRASHPNSAFLTSSQCALLSSK